MEPAHGRQISTRGRWWRASAGSRPSGALPLPARSTVGPSVVEVLVIERSAARGEALSRLLRSRGYSVSWSSSYEEIGAGLGSRMVSPTLPFLALGLPGADHPLRLQTLEALETHRFRTLGVVLVVEEVDEELDRWIARRPHHEVVRWQALEQAAPAMDRVISAATTTTSAAADPEVSEPTRILLVDDSPTTRVKYRRLLVRQRYQVTATGCSEEAFNRAVEGVFDLAIVDFFMPGGNGDALCRRLAADPRSRRIRTAILTSTYSDGIIRASLDAGARDCFFKHEADELFLARVAAMSRSIQDQKLEEARRLHLEAILGSVGEGVFGVDSHGRITFINSVALRTLGYGEDPAPLLGHRAHALFHHATEEGTEIPLERCHLHGAYHASAELRSWETVFWHRSGRAVAVECTVLPLTVHGGREGSVVAFRDLSERRRLDAQLSWLTAHDTLTGLANRSYLEEQLGLEIQRLATGDDQSALLHLDLDHFSYINETAGPAAGDRILKQVGQQIRAALRPGDLVARLGGDEFAALVYGVDPASASHLAERVREAVSECCLDVEGRTCRIFASIGLEPITGASGSPGAVLANADIACSVAKRDGRNRVHLYDESGEERSLLSSELQWSSRLREALNKDGFTLHFQPIVPLAKADPAFLPCEDGLLWEHLGLNGSGEELYEVLLRMQGPAEVAVSPREFLKVAERFNLMLDIDTWVVRQALKTLADLRQTGRRLSLSVNLSPQILETDGLLPFLKHAIQEHAIPPQSLFFEITESTAARNIERAKSFICELKDLGCRFALDDFGTGFSSFFHLKSLPVDVIKIDGLFVRGMADNQVDRTMVEYINDIAHSLGRSTVAEGVEDADTLALLQSCGVDFVQGFFISRPRGSIDSAPGPSPSPTGPSARGG